MTALADLSGLTPAGILRIERGSKPKIDTAYAIVAVLDEDIRDVFPDTTEVEEVVSKVNRVKK